MEVELLEADQAEYKFSILSDNMANFARIDNDKIVQEVIIIDDSDCVGGQYPESEPAGQEFIKKTLKIFGTWKQTSFNENFRYNFAKPGMFFDKDKDAFYWKDAPDPNFVPPLIFNEEKLKWYWETPNPFAFDEEGNPLPEEEGSVSQIRNYW